MKMRRSIALLLGLTVLAAIPECGGMPARAEPVQPRLVHYVKHQDVVCSSWDHTRWGTVRYQGFFIRDTRTGSRIGVRMDVIALDSACVFDHEDVQEWSGSHIVAGGQTSSRKPLTRLTVIVKNPRWGKAVALDGWADDGVGVGAVVWS